MLADADGNDLFAVSEDDVFVERDELEGSESNPPFAAQPKEKQNASGFLIG